jgi:hypothetical protein
MAGPVAEGRLEDETLVIALTLALGLDAVIARRTLFAALDAALSTGQTACLGPLPRLGVGGRTTSRADW